MSKVKNLVKNVKKFTKKNSPEILVGLGIVGFGYTVYTSITGTVKAVRIVDEKKKELGVDHLPAKEIIKSTWKCYIPSTVGFIGTTACIVSGTNIQKKRTAIAAGALDLTQKAFSEYKEKVIETIGEKKEEKIQNEIVEDRIKAHPEGSSQVIVTSNGDDLVYDVRSDRYFTSSYDKIKKVENVINRILTMDDYVSLNQVYDELDLNHTREGDSVGWRSIDFGREGLEIEIGTHLTENGKPCLSITFSEPPKLDFDLYG